MKSFGPFVLDTVNHCLWRGGERTPLTPKAFDVLRYLVENAGRVVTPGELLEALWTETYVNPEGIRKYILEIRKALGERGRASVFIETLPKRGYKFVAPVQDAAAPLEPFADDYGTMVGRQAGLTRLDALFEAAAAGRRQVVFVTGEAGIGKTMLVDMFLQRVRQPGVRIARGQCIEGFGGKEAYYAMLEALGSMFQGAESGALLDTLATCAPTWLVQFPAILKPEQRESLQHEILGTTRERMVREICEALESITAPTPLIVVLEDLHWADRSTLDLISAVARRREPARLMLIGTYRPADVALSQSPLKHLKHDLLIRGLCQEVAIERLEETDVAEYLRKVFAVTSSPAGLASVIHRNSGGNPLFMTAIVQDMTGKGLIAERRGTLTLSAPLAGLYPGIPETLQQMLDIQLEHLSPEDQRILESGSIAGERFSVWAASSMLELAPAAVEEACEKLASRQQFIHSIGMHDAPDGAASPYYEFRHALYREALYRRLSSSNRVKLHQSLGERLAPVCAAGRKEFAAELAMHFEEARDFERAARYLIVTAENANSRFAHRDSIEILEYARELVQSLGGGPGVELEIEILHRIGDAYYTLGVMEEAVESYTAAAERAAAAGAKTAQIHALARLAFPVWSLDPERGNLVSEQAIEVSRAHGDPLLLAQRQLAAACFRLLYDSWRKEDAKTCAAARQTIFKLGGSSMPEDVFYVYVETIQGHYEHALQQAEAVMRGNNPAAHLLALGAVSLILMPAGRFGEVLRMIRSGREAAQKNGADAWLLINAESWLRVISFDFEGVRRLSDTYLSTTKTRAYANVATGYAELGRGNFQQALGYFLDVCDTRITPKFFLHWHWRNHAAIGAAETRLRAGDIPGARRDADRVLEDVLACPEPNMLVLAWEVKCRVTAAEGDFERAREYLTNALEILEKFDLPVVGWRLHAAAWDLYRSLKDAPAAESHRARAQELMLRIANSFEPGEPLREIMLNAPPVRRIFDAPALSSSV